jgi:hypothetical protein
MSVKSFITLVPGLTRKYKTSFKLSVRDKHSSLLVLPSMTSKNVFNKVSTPGLAAEGGPNFCSNLRSSKGRISDSWSVSADAKKTSDPLLIRPLYPKSEPNFLSPAPENFPVPVEKSNRIRILRPVSSADKDPLRFEQLKAEKFGQKCH